MTNIEFDKSDLETAAKALGCERYLPKKNSPQLKDSPLCDRYIQDAMKGCVSFLPDVPEVKRVPYADLLRGPSRSGRRLTGQFAIRDQARSLMTKRPGL